MQRHKAESIGDILAQYLRGTEAEKGLLERRVVASWSSVMGESVAAFTGDMEMKNGVLYVHIHSAALKQQLFECRHQLVKKLNDAVGSRIVTDIRILG